MSSGSGNRPSGIRCLAVASYLRTTASWFFTEVATTSNGNPSDSRSSEGLTISAHFSRPHRSHSVPIPAIIPGGPIASGPHTLASSSTEQSYSFSFIPVCPFLTGPTLYICSCAAAGETELPSRDHVCPVAPSRTSPQLTYPPTPVACGRSIQQAIQAAAAASIALPPCSSIRAPIRADSSGPAETAPTADTTSLPSTIGNPSVKWSVVSGQ